MIWKASWGPPDQTCIIGQVIVSSLSQLRERQDPGLLLPSTDVHSWMLHVYWGLCWLSFHKLGQTVTFYFSRARQVLGNMRQCFPNAITKYALGQWWEFLLWGLRVSFSFWVVPTLPMFPLSCVGKSKSQKPELCTPTTDPCVYSKVLECYLNHSQKSVCIHWPWSVSKQVTQTQWE